VRQKITMLTLTVIVIIGWFTATMLGSHRPQLGLDLQGGLSVVLVPVKGSDLSTLDAAVQIIRNRVDGLGIAEPDVTRQGNRIAVDLPGVKDRNRALETVGATAELRFRQVITTLPWSAAPSTATTTPAAANPNGTTTTTKPSTSANPATSTTKKALARRSIDAKPISVVRPAQNGTTTAAATTPTTKARAAPGTTAKGGSTTTTTAPQQVNSCQAGKLVTPDDKDTADNPQVILPDFVSSGPHHVCYVLSSTIMTGRNVGTASKEVDPQTGAWQVSVHFKNNEFVDKIGTKLVGKNVAIVLDHVVYSAPVIQEQITTPDVRISGSFSEKDAGRLAVTLKYGSLPIQFDKREQTVQDISPTLGKDQLHAGIAAGLIGLGLVALYMIFFYRLLGVVVWVGLGLTGMTFFALTTWLSSHQGLTLTLAGVTGIIVSVGVTVDSYVVYFERLKDEVRTGKTVRSSLDVGFRRAFRTIVAADFVSLLGAAVLYALGTGSVRGFAYFLGLSTLLDLILAYTFMHPFVMLLARKPSLVRIPGVGIAAGLDTPGVRA
jgi:preprotein translocase subunit SecD